MKNIQLFILFISIVGNPFSQEITNEKIWNTNEFRINYIQGFKSMNNGEYFSKISTMNDSTYITKHKFTEYKGEGELIVNLSRFKEILKNQKIDGYQFNNSEEKLLLTSASKPIYRRSYEAIYFLLNLKNNQIEPLSETYSPQTLVEYSPDGKLVSFIHKNNIYIKELASKDIKQVTFDGLKNKIINGTTDWVYEEEFAITKAYYWSPDSKKIAFLKFDESSVKEINMPIYGELYPVQEKFKYPKAGEDNSKVSLNIYEFNSRKIVPIQLDEYEYIPRFRWTKNDNILIVQTLNRHQNNLKLNKVIDTESGYKSSTFYTDISNTYIEIDDNLKILSDNSILLSSENDGYKHLYHLELDGEISQITKGKWDIIDFYGINEDSKKIYYSSSETGTINKSIYSININGKNKKIISNSIGYSEAEFSNGMKYFIKTYSTANTPYTFSLCNTSGDELFILENNNKLSHKLNEYETSDKTFFKIKGVNDSLNASIIKPKKFNPNKKYPIYLHVYGGPGNNTVLNKFKGSEYLYHQILSSKGYIVLSIDPRGTMYRGVEFKKSTYMQLGKLELEDIIAATKNFHKENSFVNPNRIGIQGWSYGGYLTTLAMTKGKNLFKMGIAVAPVTNWEFYDNIYTERFMRTPQENKSGYENNSPINFANELEGNYLIVHGSADDNVHLQNTMEMIDVLIQSNKEFESFIYPNKNHGIYGGNTRNHLFNKMLNFTINKL